MNGGADIWQSVVDDMKSRGAGRHGRRLPHHRAVSVEILGPPVHINTDAAASLQTNLGITDAEAAAIVKYRTDNGNFKSWEDVMKVPGLDMSKLAGLQGRIKYT